MIMIFFTAVLITTRQEQIRLIHSHSITIKTFKKAEKLFLVLDHRYNNNKKGVRKNG